MSHSRSDRADPVRDHGDWTATFGTTELGTNSVITWLVARSGLDTDPIRPPSGGRAPGWGAGLVVANRDH